MFKTKHYSTVNNINTVNEVYEHLSKIIKDKS